MTPEAQRKFNISVGTLSLLFGLAAWAAAGYVALTPAQPRPAPVSPLPVIDLASCAQALTSMGLPASVRTARIEVFRADIDDPEKLLRDASLGLAACKLELQRFCMGEGCPQPGLSMTLGSPPREGAPAAMLQAKGQTAVPRPAPAPAAKK